jgi:glycosyltransferase involved in cell wall biosynthesis
MIMEPVQNDPNNPLISILVYNYNEQHLKQCLDSIFSQDTLRNIEIVFIDDATSDGSWEAALEFVDRYPNIITIHRNRKTLGPLANLHNCLFMAKGRFCTILSNDQAFLPEYINNCVTLMLSDPYARFSLVCRTDDLFFPQFSQPLLLTSHLPLPSNFNRPLVTILCYNYNYGRYLRECLESVFAQTYNNIEVCFSDNASTDESWSIALEFARRYPGKIHITRNRKNFGPDANFSNCKRMMQGKFFVNFCSDDVLEPEYVERCVDILETNLNVGFVIVNRDVIDENSLRTHETPFYNQSCIIPGEEQAAVYMMAGVNPSVSQIMYRRDVTDNRSATAVLGARYYGTRILDFNISTDFDIAYIKDSLLLHRIHSQSDTSQIDSNLMPVIGLYVLNHQFADIASVRRMKKVLSRLPPSIDKLAGLAVRYSVRYLLAKEEQVALRYFHLAMAISPRIDADPTWQKLHEYWTADSQSKARNIEEFKNSSNLVARSISYDPPPGSIPLETNR